MRKNNYFSSAEIIEISGMIS